MDCRQWEGYPPTKGVSYASALMKPACPPASSCMEGGKGDVRRKGKMIGGAIQNGL